jgi:hypothetical protein
VQGSGQDQCKWLHEKLTQAGYTVWYDMEEDDLTERGMEEGVSRCRVALVFLSDGYMTRPFCIKELRWAKLYDCVLVGVVEKDSRHGPADFGLEARRAPADLKHVLNDVKFVEYRRRGFEAEAMLAEIVRRCGPPAVGNHEPERFLGRDPDESTAGLSAIVSANTTARRAAKRRGALVLRFCFSSAKDGGDSIARSIQAEWRDIKGGQGGKARLVAHPGTSEADRCWLIGEELDTGAGGWGHFQDEMLKLRGEVDVLHFCGHGSDSVASPDCRTISFPGIKPDLFARAICSHGPQCIVLNACETGREAQRIAEIACEEELPLLVVYWDSRVNTELCQRLSWRFYTHLSLVQQQAVEDGTGAGSPAVFKQAYMALRDEGFAQNFAHSVGGGDCCMSLQHFVPDGLGLTKNQLKALQVGPRPGGDGGGDGAGFEIVRLPVFGLSEGTTSAAEPAAASQQDSWASFSSRGAPGAGGGQVQQVAPAPAAGLPEPEPKLEAAPLGADVLHDAADSGQVDELRRLLTVCSLDVDSRADWNGSRDTALMAAAASPSAGEAVAFLLESGAAVDAQNDEGWAAIHFAAKNGRKDVLEKLLARGASATLKCGDGEGACVLAEKGKHEECLALLREHT